MIRRLIKGSLADLIMSISIFSAFAQSDEKCRGPIYSGKDVTQHAKIIQPANLSMVYLAFGQDIQGHAIIDAVLCRSGHVTDITPVDVSPPKITQFVVYAVSQIEFKPAERNWHTVSQNIRFEFRINESEPSPIDVTKAAGRLIEEIDFMGYRRLTKEEIMTWIKSRPGEVFDNDQLQKDLQAILATGNFDAQGTRVLLDEAPRGGVRMVFDVHELPLITDVRFAGLKESDQADIVAELRKQNAGVEKGAPLDPAKIKRAGQVIQQFFTARGWREVTAEALTENTSSTEVTIIFRINGHRIP